MKCKFCGKYYDTNKKREDLRFKNHIDHCKLNPNRIKYKCKFCEYVDFNYGKVANHISNCKLNPDYEKILKSRIDCGYSGVGRKHSEETKKNISEIRKKYLLENPDKVPYLLNHSSKESYPEKYFTEVFKNEGIVVVKDFRIWLYELDFCIPEKKIDIEIDGSQHYFDKKIVESDIRRTKYLEERGWVVIRINWLKYKKLSFGDRKEFIRNIKNKIDSVSGSGCGPDS